MTISLSDKELWKGVIQYGKNMSTYKMRLWKKILRRLAIGFGFLVAFHLIIQLIRYLM